MRRPDLSRRTFLRSSAGLGGALVLGCGGGGGGGREDAGPAGDDGGAGCALDPFADGTRLEDVPLVSDRTGPLDEPFGEGLDGRLYTDLSTLGPDTLITDSDRFYIRTRVPDRIDLVTPWTIRVSGLVGAPSTLSPDDLAAGIAPMGSTLLECSGNGSGADFGLMSAAEWAGIPLAQVLDGAGVLPAATRVLVSGFDDHSQPSERSTAGASWIFGLDEVERWGPFLATEMNGAPLPLDHGAPVRLLVPGWYGCTCIKWVDEIVLVDDDAPATSQMQEFASRTHQDGVPALARDYRAASMDQAAMPVRIEKWRVGGGLLYRVVGILWGGYEVTDALQIRFGEADDWRPVDVCPPQETNRTWTLWSHAWAPPAPGRYDITLRVDDPEIPQKRLDTGFYLRSVDIAEV